MSHPLHLTDAEFVARLTQTEDSFVERKSQTDKSGWLRATVAFANSTPIGLPSVLFIGVSDDGQISANVDVEKTLQAFSDHVGAHAWPPIYALPRELTMPGDLAWQSLYPEAQNGLTSRGELLCALEPRRKMHHPNSLPR